MNDLQIEERSVTAQLSWKRALEDNSPVMVNGSTGYTAEPHESDPFQQDLFVDDQPKDLREEETGPVCGLQNEQNERKVNEDEDEVEKEEKILNTVDEEKPKPDALDDLYTCLASSDLYNSLSTLEKRRENTLKVGTND